jgi:hypothetical protein
MSKVLSILGIIGGVAVVAAAGAGATYYFLNQPATPVTPAPVTPAPAAVAPPAPGPAPATPAPTPAPAAANPPPASESAGGSAEPEPGGVSAPDVASVEFSSLVQPFSLEKDSAAYVAASSDAPQMYPLRAGTPLTSTEKSKDGKWVIALTEDGQAAYLPASDLGPYDPSKVPAPELPATVSGDANVLDTATLQVGDQKVTLTGVKGETGEYADNLQKLISAQGPHVDCTLQGQTYQCILPTRMDVARFALFNGAADVTDDASDDYKQQAEAAKAGHRGIWQEK